MNSRDTRRGSSRRNTSQRRHRRAEALGPRRRHVDDERRHTREARHHLRPQRQRARHERRVPHPLLQPERRGRQERRCAGLGRQARRPGERLPAHAVAGHDVCLPQAPGGHRRGHRRHLNARLEGHRGRLHARRRQARLPLRCHGRPGARLHRHGRPRAVRP